MSYVAKALSLGFIGLDFADPPGDLTDVDPSAIEKTQRDYWDFAHKMAVGDVVLVSAHHYPFALVEVTGTYNYIRCPGELEVWFRHFRRVSVLGYYADLVTNPKSWDKITMTDTISILYDTQSKTFQLINYWLSKIEQQSKEPC
ncbi:hypothetical protein [Xanthomonas phaseoli]|uniref:hypothetical protein n=1 Tax=Xanthomonas phaseoli TaxID=1985254 RepID=UPI001930F43F|nr:hypothetical protein [Xanthomonas phaseoli]